MLALYFAIDAGGALGAVSRAGIAYVLPSTLWMHFPLPIMCVNIVGCFVMGALTELMALY